MHQPIPRNIHKALGDQATLTQLCVFVLYTEAISHPYLRQVRTPGVNFLDLGPLHEEVKSHIRAIIENPDLLLAPDASCTTGSLDGKDWKRPEAMAAVLQRLPSLPHLRPALIEFFSGALDTWERFTEEFALSGTIAGLTPGQKQQARMDSTNDENEGAFGRMRSHWRQAWTMSQHQYNARAVTKMNGTTTYMETLTPTDFKFLRGLARFIDESGVEKARRREQAEADARLVAKKRADGERRQARVDAKKEALAAFTPTLDIQAIEAMTVKQLDQELDWHREYCDPGSRSEKLIPPKSKMRKADMVRELKLAVSRYEKAPFPVPVGMVHLQPEDMEVEDGYDVMLEEEDVYMEEC